jgi:hypothetical protein
MALFRCEGLIYCYLLDMSTRPTSVSVCDVVVVVVVGISDGKKEEGMPRGAWA